MFVICSEMSLKKIKIPVPAESEFLGLGQESVFNLRFNLKENLKVSHVLDARVSVGFWFGLGGWATDRREVELPNTIQSTLKHLLGQMGKDRPIFLFFILFKTHTQKSMAILLPNFCPTPTLQFLCTEEFSLLSQLSSFLLQPLNTDVFLRILSLDHYYS